MGTKFVLAIMRMAEVCAVTKLSESTVRRLQDPEAPQYDPAFPRSFPLSLRARGFDGPAVLAWVAARNDRAQGELQ